MSAQAAGKLILKSEDDDDLTKIVAQKEWDPVVDAGFLSAKQETTITSSVDVDEDVIDQLQDHQ